MAQRVIKGLATALTTFAAREQVTLRDEPILTNLHYLNQILMSNSRPVRIVCKVHVWRCTPHSILTSLHITEQDAFTEKPTVWIHVKPIISIRFLFC